MTREGLKVRVAIVAIVVLLVVPSAFGQQRGLVKPTPYTAEQASNWILMAPQDVFRSDDALSAALYDITLLGPKATEALARTIGDCVDVFSAKEELRSHCDRARRYFVVLSDLRSPLGRVFAAYESSMQLVRLTSRGTTGTSPENAARIDRMVDIERAFEDAVRTRLRLLDK
jgi:hypothetical protein